MTVGLNRADGRVCVRESHHHAMGVPVNHLIVDPRLHDDGDGLACELHLTPFYDEDGLTLYQADVLDGLAALPADSVDCVVTSPPYWSLRSYSGEQERVWGGAAGCQHAWDETSREGEGYHGAKRWQHGGPMGEDDYQRTLRANGDLAQLVSPSTTCARCGAWRGSYGLEPTHTMYVAHTVEVLRAVRRVLKPTGVVWWNIADSYAGGGGFSPTAPSTATSKSGQYGTSGALVTGGIRARGLKPKDMCLIPQRVAIALQEDGWYVRCDVIWSKPNPMPESVTDRPTKSHEYIWLLSKSARYWWDADAVREAQSEGTFARYGKDNRIPANDKWAGESRASMSDHLRARDGDVKAILPNGRNIRSVWTMPTQPSPLPHFAMFPEALAERCIKASCPLDGVVLDPFAGMCTTLKVARDLGRRAIGIELSAEYAEKAVERLRYGVRGAVAIGNGQGVL